MTTCPPRDVEAIQHRTVRTLVTAQVFSGLGNGSTLALGSILAVDLAGSEAWAGAVTMAMTFGTALSAIPLSQLAVARGRRLSLTTGLAAAIVGTGLMVIAVMTRSFPVLLIGSLAVGFASAVNLQARFAVTDLARPEHRGRDLSYVVWAITVGAVLGPNTVRPGAVLAEWLAIPALAGPFLISTAGMVIGATIVWWRLRPDPLLTRRDLDARVGPSGPSALPARRPTSWRAGWDVVRPHPSALGAILAVVAAHAVMVAVMSMTPLHMEHGAPADAAAADTISLIGLTISAHIAGMYAFSPVMGALADRFGARAVALGGLGLLFVAVAVTGVFAATMPLVTVGLVLLGLGWSAATVAGSTLVVSALEPAQRVPAQGLSDAAMSLAGALSAAVAGPLMGFVDYRGVSAAGGVVLVLAVVGVVHLTRRDPATHVSA